MKRAVLALKAAPSPQTTLFCLSNSNQVFIDVILKVSDDNSTHLSTHHYFSCSFPSRMKALRDLVSSRNRAHTSLPSLLHPLAFRSTTTSPTSSPESPPTTLTGPRTESSSSLDESLLTRPNSMDARLDVRRTCARVSFQVSHSLLVCTQSRRCLQAARDTLVRFVTW